jgi:hypothetical protein
MNRGHSQNRIKLVLVTLGLKDNICLLGNERRQDYRNDRAAMVPFVN